MDRVKINVSMGSMDVSQGENGRISAFQAASDCSGRRGRRFKSCRAE